MSLFDLQDVCIAIGSIATLDLPMVVDLIGIHGLKGPYCTLTTTNWFLQEISVIPRGSWSDVARRSYHDPLGKSGIVIPEPQWLWAHGWLNKRRLPFLLTPPPPFAGICSVQLDEENPSAPISSGLLVQADEGVSLPVMDLIDVIYRRLPEPSIRTVPQILTVNRTRFLPIAVDLHLRLEQGWWRWVPLFETFRLVRLWSLGSSCRVSAMWLKRSNNFAISDR
ncbi:putative LRR receptor-like serine/threonine-protein kinase [Dorcoceras hygrometricum]|uniref:Putative LRR receptor-like serine/threonine-protein kinase n=1 Tax=Dorcoceras hygrometricum TaxID=472368 RepID=A0A2Z7CT22_9LAMI|nr:putative LRR receptor-like serine/threonine-protein kinase [Dorcoceras hygrometricum]